MMKQFKKIPSIIQILAAEWVSVMFLFPIVSKLYERTHPSVGYRSLPLDTTDYVFFTIGLLIFTWLLATIFRPAVHETRFVPVFHGGGAHVANPQMADDYLFSSTHPSYVFIDLLSCSLWWFARWAWSEGWQERVYQGNILLLLGAIIPALRLLAWYVLRLRPKGDEEFQQEVQSSWKPVAILCSILLLLALAATAVIIPVERREKREQERKEANLTLVDAAGWRGSVTFEALRDPDHEGSIATRVIRLRAMQKSSEATTCTNDAGQGTFATVLATLGKNEDMLIFSYDDPGGLVQRASANQGQPIEVLGRLTHLPHRIPAWKRYCGLEKLSPRPRWAFEEEKP
jgi:hypothetical protein